MKVKLDPDALDELARSADVEKALKVAADVGAETAERLAPVDSGDLKRSIGSDSEAGRANVHVDVSYWMFPEFGTRYMTATPYMRPAVDAMKRVFS